MSRVRALLRSPTFRMTMYVLWQILKVTAIVVAAVLAIVPAALLALIGFGFLITGIVLWPLWFIAKPRRRVYYRGRW